MDVPEGIDKPYVFSGSAFIKKGISVKKIGPEEYEKISVPSKPHWEFIKANGVTVDDLDHEEIIQTVEEAKKERLATDFKYESVKDILEYLNLLAKNIPTKVAVILFGKNTGRIFPQNCIHCVKFAGTDRKNMLQLLPPFEGNLFSLLRKAVTFIESNLPRHIETREKNIMRKSTFLIPKEAWLEALINALCHRDYLDITGRINVSLYKDRLEIWNKGELPVGMKIEELKQNHASRPINPIIAKVLFLRGFIDTVGRGTNRIVESCVTVGLPEPIYSLHSGGFETKLLMTKPLMLNKRQTDLLKRIKVKQTTTLAEYRMREGKKVQERQAREDLRQLVEDRYLRKEGKGRATRYIRIK